MFRHAEGKERLAGILALAADEPPSLDLARALQATAMVEALLTPTEATVALARQSVELFERFGDRQGAAVSKLLLGMTRLQRGEPDAARPAEEAEVTFIEVGDAWGEATAGLIRFVVHAQSLGPEPAEDVGRRLLERFRALDDHWGIAFTLFSVGEIARLRGDLAGAVRHFEGALAAARDAGPMWIVSASLIYLGTLAALQGDDARGAALHAEAIALSRRTGQRRGLAFAWNEMGGIARARGEIDRARHLHQEALTIVREILMWSVPHTLAQLGCAEARLGEREDAEAHLREAAALVLGTAQPATAAVVLVGLALVANGRGRAERAAVLLGAAAATRERAGVIPVGADRAEAELARDGASAQLGTDAFQVAFATGHDLATDEALRVALDRRDAAGPQPAP
jgi:tetratricopeptide (TPR) repeat protein